MLQHSQLYHSTLCPMSVFVTTAVQTATRRTNTAQIQKLSLNWKSLERYRYLSISIEATYIKAVNFRKAISPAAIWTDNKPKLTGSHLLLLLLLLLILLEFLLCIYIYFSLLITTWGPEPFGTTTSVHSGRPLCICKAASVVFGTVQLLLVLSATAGEDETSGHYKRPCHAPCEFSTSVTCIHTYMRGLEL